MENKNYCDNCSSELKVNAVFCENCGEKVSQKTKPRNVAKDEKTKKRLLYVLLSLSILLGVAVTSDFVSMFLFYLGMPLFAFGSGYGVGTPLFNFFFSIISIISSIIFLVAFFKIKNTEPKSQSVLVFLYTIEVMEALLLFFSFFSYIPRLRYYINNPFLLFSFSPLIIFVLLIFAIYLQIQYSKILKLTIQDEIKSDTNFVPTPFCPHCGAEQDTGPNALKTAFCPHCGAMKNSNSNLSSVASDEGGFLYGLLGFFIPLAGFIIWVVSKETKPRAAKTAGTWALISVSLSLFMFVILLMIFFSYSI